MFDWIQGSKDYNPPKHKDLPKTFNEWADNYLRDFDLDLFAPWQIEFPKDHKAWRKGIDMAKDMMKVDGATHVYSTWSARVDEDIDIV